MAKNPKTQEHFAQLQQHPNFIALQQAARKDPDSINEYVERARREFRLSGYWTELLRHILLSDLSPKNLAGGAVIETSVDVVTEQPVYKVVVYPEATQDSIVRAYSIIQKRYKEAGLNKRYRASERFDLEAEAMHLRAQGLSSEGIADKLGLVAYEIPDLIAKAKKKLQS